MLAIHRILYPTDFSDLARPAFAFACALARDFGAELIIAHVAPPPIATVVDGVVIDIPSGEAEQTEARLRQIIPSDQRIRFVHRLVKGDPAPQILNLARDLDVNLIVMGTHGRTGLGRLLVGSVAEQVMRHATCPVLTVKGTLPLDAIQEQSGSSAPQ